MKKKENNRVRIMRLGCQINLYDKDTLRFQHCQGIICRSIEISFEKMYTTAMDELSMKINAFFVNYKRQLYKKGEVVIRADDDPAGIYFLDKGIVKAYAISQNGEELVLNIFKPGAFFPMSWAINSTPNKYFFEAITDLVVWRAPRDEAITFLKENPDVVYDLLSRVYKGIDGVFDRMVYLMSGSAYERLLTDLLIHVKRFGSGDEQMTLGISETELASQTGMTRETISREMKRLKDKGIVTVQNNHFLILSVQALEHELSVQ